MKVFSSSNGTFQGNKPENQLDLFNLGPVAEVTSQGATNESLFAVDFLNNMPDNVDSGVQDNIHRDEKPIVSNSNQNNDLADLMSGSVQSTSGAKAMDKNSILALYSQSSKLKLLTKN